VRADIPTYAELADRTDGPAGSSWGLFGPRDEVGAINMIGAEDVVSASRLVKKGAVFSLDHPVNAFPPTPARPAATHSVITMAPNWRDDRLDSFYLQQTSQVDGLRHTRHPVHGFYGGVSPDSLVAGDPTIGVNRWADRCIVGRGVLIDVARYREHIGKPLDHAAGEPITTELLDETLEYQRTDLSSGALVLLRTAFTEYLASFDGQRPTTSAGLRQDRETVRWLWDHRVPLAASDNNALECLPVVDGSPFRGGGETMFDGTMHFELIAMLGMVVGELWKLDELALDCASDGVYEFLLVVKPLNLIGGVGSPPNATAIK